MFNQRPNSLLGLEPRRNFPPTPTQTDLGFMNLFSPNIPTPEEYIKYFDYILGQGRTAAESCLVAAAAAITPLAGPNINQFHELATQKQQQQAHNQQPANAQSTQAQQLQQQQQQSAIAVAETRENQQQPQQPVPQQQQQQQQQALQMPQQTGQQHQQQPQQSHANQSRPKQETVAYIPVQTSLQHQAALAAACNNSNNNQLQHVDGTTNQGQYLIQMPIQQQHLAAPHYQPVVMQQAQPAVGRPQMSSQLSTNQLLQQQVANQALHQSRAYLGTSARAKLTDEERIRNKRERNRKAAANCRRRKDEKLRILQEENDKLRRQIDSLQATIDCLRTKAQ